MANNSIAVKKYTDQAYLGARKRDPITKQLGAYEFSTFGQVHKKVLTLANGLHHLLKTHSLFSEDDITAISLFAINRPEWIMTDIAASYHSLVTVGLFDTFGPQTLEYILNHTKSPICIASKDKIPNILQIAPKLEYLKILICMDSLEDRGKQGTISNVIDNWNLSLNNKFELIDFNELLKLGEENSYPHNLPKPDDLLTICYTSGTTGKSKGVLLTHKGFVSVNYIMVEYMNQLAPATLSHLSYMPLSHCYERMTQYSCIYRGAKVGFYSGDVTKILEDINLFGPSAFASVPRLLNRICDGIASKTINGKGLVSTIFKLGYQAKLNEYEKNGSLYHPIWNPLLFNKLKQVLGGNVHYIASGSAPLSRDVLKFLRIAFSVPVFEGYGISETCSLISIAPLLDNSYDTVGAPLGINEVKLVSIPEMNYFVTDKPYPRGELLVRGANVFKGYYKEPEKTAEAFDSEGFFRTGDICYISEAGLISIIDRKSSFFKLSQGEFITPERVENAILNHPAIQLAFLTGIRTESTTVTVVVPDYETFGKWFATEFPEEQFTNIRDACKSEKVKSAILADIRKLCLEAKVAK